MGSPAALTVFDALVFLAVAIPFALLVRHRHAIPALPDTRDAGPPAALSVVIPARDEESNIGRTVESLRDAFPGTEVIVADDGSRDGTAAEAKRAGARVLSLPARGKGQALTLAERAAPAGRLLLVDADLEGDLAKLAAADGDLAIAAFAERRGGGTSWTADETRWPCLAALRKAEAKTQCAWCAVVPLTRWRMLACN